MQANQNNWTRRKRWPLLAGTLGVTLTLTGCLTLEEMAPPVGPAFSIAETNGATLETGRDLYVIDCTRCHSVEPISRYSVAHWRDIIKRMAPESKLDETQTAALRAYVLAAHKVLAQQAAGE